jgi:hypothetical protein|tara:strand:- start:1026 stop:1238 length:213 start_codon:yes stop_codon:yes gene_type:complete
MTSNQISLLSDDDLDLMKQLAFKELIYQQDNFKSWGKSPNTISVKTEKCRRIISACQTQQNLNRMLSDKW